MRCALAEFTISKALVDHIFLDMYCPLDAELQRAISYILATLEEDTRRERLVRCQLLAVFKGNVETFSRAFTLAQLDIHAMLDPLLPAGSIRDKFHGQVDELLKEAIAIWEPLQTSKDRVSAELSLGLEELGPEDRYGNYDTTSDASIAQDCLSIQEEPIVPLFPQIRMGDKILYPAMALWSNQAAVAEAIRFGRALGQSKPAHASLRRRMSVTPAARVLSSPSPGSPPLPIRSSGDKQPSSRPISVSVPPSPGVRSTHGQLAKDLKAP
jgi:hypothetical protein